MDTRAIKQWTGTSGRAHSFTASALLIATLFAAGCGGGSGSGSPTSPPMPPQNSVELAVQLILSVSPSGACANVMVGELDGREVSRRGLSCGTTAQPLIFHVSNVSRGRHTVSARFLGQGSNRRLRYPVIVVVERIQGSTVSEILRDSKEERLLGGEAVSWTFDI